MKIFSIPGKVSKHNSAYMKSVLFLLLFIYFLTFNDTSAQEVLTVSNIDSTIYLPMISKSGSPAASVVVNGDFEAGRTGWIEFENSVFFDFPLIVQEKNLPALIKPYNGQWVAWLGGESDLISYIEQEITLPLSGLELVYWYWIDSIFQCDGSSGGVFINATAVDQFPLCETTDTAGWQKRTVNLSAFSGQTVMLRFISQTKSLNFSSLYIDVVSISR